jgi:hypothetical protein
MNSISEKNCLLWPKEKKKTRDTRYLRVSANPIIYCRQSAYFLIEFVCKAQVQSMVSPINEYTLEDNTVFSIEGKGLKLNTAEDVQPFVDTILQMDDLQEIRMSGNTIGVEAGKALAGALQSRKTIKVSLSIISFCLHLRVMAVRAYHRP